MNPSSIIGNLTSLWISMLDPPYLEVLNETH
jgi:hypothetical protein